jgi:hypothetical protein
MVEREPLERGPQRLVIDAVVVRVRPGDRTGGTGSPLPGGVAGTVTTAVQHDPVEVRTWLGQLVPSPIDLDERVMDEISSIVSIADEERSTTHLPRELPGIERCERATASTEQRDNR